MSVLLSVASTGLHLLNAAGFILLAPGDTLADYISGSVLMGIVSWTAIWVLPSVYEYRMESVRDLRSLQVMLVMAGLVLLLATHPNLIGLLLSALLVLEVAVFLPFLMLFESRTTILISADFCRALLNSVGLLLTIFLFRGEPAAYVAGLLVSLAVVSLALWIPAIHRPPFPRPRLGLRLFVEGLRAAFRSLSFRQLLGARLIEATTTLALNAAGLLGPILALKAGNVAVQATAFNARRLSLAQALGLGMALYLAGMGTILAANHFVPDLTPASLRLVGLREVLVALVPFLGMLVLTVLSIKVKPVEPPSAEQG